MSELNEDTFRHLCKDVKEIKGALIGSDAFGQKGLVQRTATLENDVENLKNFKKKIVYYAAGAAGGGAGLIQLLFNAI